MEIMFRLHSFMLHEIQQFWFCTASCRKKMTLVLNFTSYAPTVYSEWPIERLVSPKKVDHKIEILLQTNCICYSESSAL